MTSFQHSPRCSLELINYKISSFLSSPFLSYISLPSLCFPGNILSTSWEDQKTIARNCPITFSFFNGSSYNSFQYSLLSSLGSFPVIFNQYKLNILTPLPMVFFTNNTRYLKQVQILITHISLESCLNLFTYKIRNTWQNKRAVCWFLRFRKPILSHFTGIRSQYGFSACLL